VIDDSVAFGRSKTFPLSFYMKTFVYPLVTCQLRKDFFKQKTYLNLNPFCQEFQNGDSD